MNCANCNQSMGNQGYVGTYSMMQPSNTLPREPYVTTLSVGPMPNSPFEQPQMTQPPTVTQIPISQTQPSSSNYMAMQQMPLSQNPGQVGVITGDVSPIKVYDQPMPISGENMQYLNGFLRTQIGRKITAEFLIGTNTLIDRTGTLIGVGANYIIINEVETDDILVCDFYNLKFVKMYY